MFEDNKICSEAMSLPQLYSGTKIARKRCYSDEPGIGEIEFPSYILSSVSLTP